MNKEETDYSAAVDDITSRRSKKEDPTRDSTRKTLELLDHPENDYRVVLVGGTNGKGFTVEMISELLQHHGKKVGTYRSPHLTSCRERIQINGEKISKEEFLELYRRIDGLDTELTFFEFMTSASYLYFSDENVDYAVMEVGMGGRLDATNVTEPDLSVITNVGDDHEKYLGETVEERAWELGGIIQSNPVVLGEMLDTLIEIAEDRNAEILGKKVVDGNANTVLKFNGKGFQIPVRGSFQSENLGVALSAVEKLEEIPEDLGEALSGLECRGRMEVRDRNPLYIHDGAHNPSAVEKILQDLPEDFICVFNATKSKDYDKMISLLEQKASKFYFTESDVEWATENAEKLAQETEIDYEIERDPEEAVRLARKEASLEVCVLVTGSLYLIGAIRKSDS
ncbi:MAG: folylpolyglutamate synthase/dihydrofolate synthase family protein [Candidatus Nanosalina sp.]